MIGIDKNRIEFNAKLKSNLHRLVKSQFVEIIFYLDDNDLKAHIACDTSLADKSITLMKYLENKPEKMNCVLTLVNKWIPSAGLKIPEKKFVMTNESSCNK